MHIHVVKTISVVHHINNHQLTLSYLNFSRGSVLTPRISWPNITNTPISHSSVTVIIKSTQIQNSYCYINSLITQAYGNMKESTVGLVYTYHEPTCTHHTSLTQALAVYNTLWFCLQLPPAMYSRLCPQLGRGLVHLQKLSNSS